MRRGVIAFLLSSELQRVFHAHIGITVKAYVDIRNSRQLDRTVVAVGKAERVVPYLNCYPFAFALVEHDTLPADKRNFCT